MSVVTDYISVMESILDAMGEALGRLRAAVEDASPRSEAVESAVPFLRLSDSALLLAASDVEQVGRAADVLRAMVAGELGRRSSRELGYSGLAVKNGFRTPEAMLQSVTRVSQADAARRVRVGESIAPSIDSVSGEVIESRFGAVADAVLRGRLGIDSADSIVRTLSKLSPEVPEALIKDAEQSLVDAGRTLDPDSLAKQARSQRDSLDREGILDREGALRAQRFLRVGREVDGMRRLSGSLDPESAGMLMPALDALTSARTGGPRFVDADAQAEAARFDRDERTTDQLRLDGLIDLVSAGVTAATNPTMRTVRPAVRVTVSSDEIAAQAGAGWIEGVTDPVSVQTARRFACDAGVQRVLLAPDGEVLDIGRAQRSFTPSMRVALAVRDGGCRWFGCDRPAHMCEAHHIVQWAHGGSTSVENGVLLCRHHHMLLHNNGWQLKRLEKDRPPSASGRELCLIPPPEIDRERKPIPVPSKHPVHRFRRPRTAPDDPRHVEAVLDRLEHPLS